MMKFKSQTNYNYQFVGKLNFFQSGNIIRKVKKITANEWDEYTFRQNTFAVHRHTKTIPIIFDEDFRMKEISYTKWYSSFETDLKKIQKIVSKKYGDGYINRCILTKLLSGRVISPHCDSGLALSLGKRIHIPLITNRNVEFSVDGEVKNMKRGEMWEINNTNKIHSVCNHGKDDRVHLILDYVLV